MTFDKEGIQLEEALFCQNSAETKAGAFTAGS